jgi:hypothetical protein
MSQKSSVLQLAKNVSQALTPDSPNISHVDNSDVLGRYRHSSVNLFPAEPEHPGRVNFVTINDGLSIWRLSAVIDELGYGANNVHRLRESRCRPDEAHADNQR